MLYDGVQERPGMRADGMSWLWQEWPKSGRAVVDDSLDRWLGCSLHEAFDTVIAEPLPEELLHLIEETCRRQRRA